MDAEEFEAVVIAQLRAEIAAAGKSQKDVATAADLPYVSFVRYMRGERPMTLRTLKSILGVLGVEPATFYARVQERVGADA